MSRERRPRSEPKDEPSITSQPGDETSKSIDYIISDLVDIKNKINLLEANISDNIEKTTKIGSNLEIDENTIKEKLGNLSEMKANYQEVSYKIMTINDRINKWDSRLAEYANLTNKVDELTQILGKTLGNIGSDVHGFTTYGKLFLGLGTAAIMIYIVTAVLNIIILRFGK